eukprot:TRINITY_DN2117_c0_g1_i1.p1 TRINITY_DN2117_c0_g1~~TRINITY_DN2117_c0_g1_i1.p1  ORF type:complete len:616 (-),score=148.00 TRINITY_DN2117_c0_g1_i1:171-1853(-)
MGGSRPATGRRSGLPVPVSASPPSRTGTAAGRARVATAFSLSQVGDCRGATRLSTAPSQELAARAHAELLTEGELHPVTNLSPLSLQLREENRLLKEELYRSSRESIGALNRRPLAAIAGGGFRGPAFAVAERSAPSRSCCCESLRVKLARLKMELEELRGEARVESRRSTKSSEPEAPPPPSAASAETQTEARSTADGAAQAELLLPEIRPVRADAGVQASGGRSPVRRNSAAQTDAPALPPPVAAPRRYSRDASVDAAPSSSAAAAQTDAPPAAAPRLTAAVQTEEALPRTPAVSSAGSQTTPPSRADACVQHSAPEPSRSCASSQTAAPALAHSAAQTAPMQRPASATTGTQTAAPAPPPAKAEQGTQKDDPEAHALEACLRKQLADAEEAAAKAAEAAKEVARLRDELAKAEVRSAELQRSFESKAFRHLNVTILCPRAECNIKGEKLEMDSWDPVKLKAQFETEVLPHFVRVIAEEAMPGGAVKQPGRSEAVEKIMQDFADVFRCRLATLLNAPSAAAAYATVASKEGAVAQKAEAEAAPFRGESRGGGSRRGIR